MKRIALALLLWLSVAPCWAINVCTETQAALADSDGIIEHTEDITAAIQECIDNAGNVDGVYDDPYIPRGTYYISDTITIPNAAGFRLRGAGVVGRTEMYAAAYYRRQYTQLRATPDMEGKPMFKITGSNTKLQDFILHGVALDNTTKASVGILVSKGTGVGTGSETFDRIHVFDMSQYGIQFGEAGQNNCDLTVCNQCEFSNCTTGAIAIINTQSMGHHIVDCRVFGSTAAGIYFTGGGKTTVTNLLLNAAGITALKGVHLSSALGPNNADLYFNNVMIDNDCGNGFKLVDSACSYLDVTFNGGVHSDNGGTYTGDLVAVQGASIVRFNGFRSNFNNMTGTAANGNTPRFIFNDCACFGGVNPRTELSGDYVVRQRGCFAWNSTFSAIQDYPAGPVQPQNPTTSGAGVGEVTAGHTEQVYGQPQTIVIDMQQVLTKYGKTIDDVDQADVTLKFRRGISDVLADYDRNSTDDASQVSYAMEDVTVADGSTESHLIVRATVAYADFGGANIRADKTYYIGCGLTFDGETGSFEPDSMVNGSVKYTTQRVD